MNTDTKYTYYRLDFENCDLEYDYTICADFEEVKDYLQLVESALDSDYEEGKQPKVTVTGVPMTDNAYELFVQNHIQP